MCHQNVNRPQDRAAASLSLPGGQDKNISSIFPHFPVWSLIFPQSFFISSSFWFSGVGGKALATVLPHGKHREADKQEKGHKITSAVTNCGYPKWALDRVKQKIKDKHKRSKSTNKTNESPSRGMVVIPYVEGVAEKIKRAFLKHDVATMPCVPRTLSKTSWFIQKTKKHH